MRDVADVGRTIKTNALPASEHFSAAATFAKAGVWRGRGGKKTAWGRKDVARGGLRDHLGKTSPKGGFEEVRGGPTAGRCVGENPSTARPCDCGRCTPG